MRGSAADGSLYFACTQRRRPVTLQTVASRSAGRHEAEPTAVFDKGLDSTMAMFQQLDASVSNPSAPADCGAGTSTGVVWLGSGCYRSSRACDAVCCGASGTAHKTAAARPAVCRRAQSPRRVGIAPRSPQAAGGLRAMNAQADGGAVHPDPLRLEVLAQPPDVAVLHPRLVALPVRHRPAVCVCGTPGVKAAS